MLLKLKIGALAFVLLCHISHSSASSRASDVAEDSNPLLDMASMFIQEALSNQQGGSGSSAGAGLAGVASLIGSFMNANNGGQTGKAGAGGGAGAMQILSGIGSLLATAGNTNARSGEAGFDPSIITNVIDMFTNSERDDEAAPATQGGNERTSGGADLNFDSMLKIASVFLNAYNAQGDSTPQQHQRQKREAEHGVSDHTTAPTTDENNLLSFLPLVMQAINSFAGPEGKQTQAKHKDHAWVLPPFLEHIHVLWDHFSNSELADALYEKSGVNKIMKGFKGRDGKLDYDKLFESLNNQSFRRRWIKSAVGYLADWASYLPEVYLKYFETAQLMFNGFLKSQGYPKNTYFEPSRPSETISNLLDYIAKQHLSVKIDSRQYVKPAVGYARELLKLGKARGLLQFNATDLSDKLTDTLNLEVIEPVLKVHRAYRYISKTPQCDRYVLCQLNSPEQQSAEKSQSSSLISGVSPKIVKIGSMGAAIFISTETGTPFWTLFGVINSPYNCEVKYPVDCSGFHHGEAKVTTPMHVEL